MVRGIQVFREFFKDFQSSYLLIGGAACDIWLERAGLAFRTTKDLDIVLMLSVIDRAFVERFHAFMREGNYENRQRSTGKRRYYRFFEPRDNTFPHMIELFSKNTSDEAFPSAQGFVAIPLAEDLSNLSAIMMDDDYYQLLAGQRRIVDDIAVVSVPGLLCLKMHAWLNLTERANAGEAVDSRDLRKHKNDVFRLFFALQQDTPVALPDTVRSDTAKFLTALRLAPWDVTELGRTVGVRNPPATESIVGELTRYFGVETGA